MPLHASHMTGFKESTMIRMPFLLALSILAIAAGNLNAQFKPVQGVTGEVRGIVKSVDGDKNTVTVAVDGALFVKEQTLLIDKDARYQPCLGKAKAAAGEFESMFLNSMFQQMNFSAPVHGPVPLRLSSCIPLRDPIERAAQKMAHA